MFAGILSSEPLRVVKGDVDGHPFRGNQYTKGIAHGQDYTDKKGRAHIGDLDPTQRKAESKFYDAIEKDLPSLIKAYQEKNGHTIDADRVKELSPDFLSNPTLFAAAVHEPSSLLSKVLFSTELDAKAKAGDTSPTILTAGGSGSGKSQAMPIVLKALNAKEGGLVFDSVLGNFGSAKSKIDEALTKTKGDVVIAYTNRKLEDAFRSNATRGRSVLTKTLVNAHTSASNNIRKLAEHYADNPRVKIHVVNNFGGIEDIHQGKLEDVPTYGSDTTERLHAIADEMHAKQEISDEKHAHITKGRTTGRSVQKSSTRIRKGQSGENAGQHCFGTGEGIRCQSSGTLEKPEIASGVWFKGIIEGVFKGDFHGHPFRGNQYTRRSVDAGTGGGTNQSGASGVSALPLRKDGRVELTHWSNVANLTSIDPSHYGKGYAGAEKSRKEADPDNWVDRSYYGIGVGQPGGYEKEVGLGSNKYTTSVDPKDLYDIVKDPDGLNPKGKLDGWTNQMSLYEKNIKDKGYAGYWLKHPSLGMVSAVFKPLKPEKSEKKASYLAVMNHEITPYKK